MGREKGESEKAGGGRGRGDCAVIHFRRG